MIWMAASFLAFFVKGLCGFANTLVFTSILSFGSNNINISPVELLLGYPTNIILAYKERSAIRWEICLPLAALVLLGSVPGILFLKNGDSRIIKIIFGFLIVLIGCEMFFRERNPKKTEQSKLLLGVIGILSGVLCGLYGVGALLGAYISRVMRDSHSFKANICVVFLAENTLRIVLYTIWGILTWPVLFQALRLSPWMLAGLLCGMACGGRLDERIVKQAVIVMLIVSGLALIFNEMKV